MNIAVYLRNFGLTQLTHDGLDWTVLPKGDFFDITSSVLQFCSYLHKIEKVDQSEPIYFLFFLNLVIGFCNMGYI